MGLYLCSYSAKTLNKTPWHTGRDLSGYIPDFSYINGIGRKSETKVQKSKSRVPELRLTLPKTAKTNYFSKGIGAFPITGSSKAKYLPSGAAKLNSLKEEKKKEEKQNAGMKFLPTAKEDLANGIVRFG